MSATHPAYAVDLDLLLGTIESLSRCERTCDDALETVSRRVRALHETWSGETALAQAATQERWEEGFGRMQAGLADMRRAADTAHGNYRGAAETNVRLWSL